MGMNCQVIIIKMASILTKGMLSMMRKEDEVNLFDKVSKIFGYGKSMAALD
jgi:hypothetical protein